MGAGRGAGETERESGRARGLCLALRSGDRSCCSLGEIMVLRVEVARNPRGCWRGLGVAKLLKVRPVLSARLVRECTQVTVMMLLCSAPLQISLSVAEPRGAAAAAAAAKNDNVTSRS